MRYQIRRIFPILGIFSLLLAAPTQAGGEPVLKVLIDSREVIEGDTLEHVGSSLQISGVAAAADGIARVLINGREVVLRQGTLRDLEVVGMEEEEAVHFYQEIPLSGEFNPVTVVAADDNGDKREVRFWVKQMPPGEIYALVVGIDDYTDPTIPDLRFAENDAEEVYHFLTDAEYSLAKSENVCYLGGPQATGKNIKRAFYDHLITKAIRPEDMVIFFYAGHGDVGTHPIKGSEYYMIPQDAELRNLFVTGIVKDDLQRLWSAIIAKRKIFISDACNSGGFTGMRGGVTYGFEEALGEGKIVFSAAKSDQKSLELDDLGHGIFTYTLLEGLKGNADGSHYGNRDGLVSVKELADYLQKEVPAMAAKVGGKQDPQIEIMEATGVIVLSRVSRPVEEDEEEHPEEHPEEHDDLQDMLSAVEHCQRAEDFLGKGDVQRAILEYKRAVLADSELEQAHAALSELYLVQKNIPRALQHAENAVAIDAKSERGHLFLGQALQGQGDADTHRVRQVFQTVLQLNPGNASAYIGLGVLSQSLGDLEQAIQHFEKAVDLVDNPATWYHLGSACVAAGKFERAERAFAQVVAIEGAPEPGENALYFLGAHRGLGFISHKKKDYAQAILSYQAALKYDEENLDLFLELGEAFVRNKDYQQSIAVLGKVTEKRPDDIRAHFSLGFALLMLGETGKGEVHLRFVERAANDPYKTQARTLLDKLRQH